MASKSPTPAPFDLPSELIALVLAQLDPRLDLPTLRSAALVSTAWHAQAFPLVHHTLIYHVWTEFLFTELKQWLSENPRVARAIRRFELCNTVISDVELWMIFWMDEHLVQYEASVARECECFCDRCGEFGTCEDWTAQVIERGFEMAETAGEEALEEEEDVRWIKNRDLSDQAFFDLLVYLPAVRDVRLDGFQVTVRADRVEGNADARPPESDEEGEEGGEGGEGFTSAGKLQPCLIDTVGLLWCHEDFKESLGNHSRFRKFVDTEWVITDDWEFATTL